MQLLKLLLEMRKREMRRGSRPDQRANVPLLVLEEERRTSSLPIDAGPAGDDNAFHGAGLWVVVCRGARGYTTWSWRPRHPIGGTPGLVSASVVLCLQRRR